MNRILSVFLALIASLAFSGSGICGEKKIVDGHLRLHSLFEKLREREIKSVEILWMDPTTESRATITPQVLDQTYFRKLMIRKLRGDKLEKSVTESVRTTFLTKMDPNAEGDVRWAIKFYEDGKSAPAVSIYLDGTGETGSIAGTPYSFNGSLFAWLDTNFSPIFAGGGNK